MCSTNQTVNFIEHNWILTIKTKIEQYCCYSMPNLRQFEN